VSAAVRPRIFVHIAAYRDRECQWTIQDLFQKATHPERVFVGVCWQVVPGEDDPCFAVPPPHPAQVQEVRFHPEQAHGLGWARQQAQAFWRGEEYALQIDSHMRFVPGWDEAMLAMLARCPSPDPVLTVYPPRYEPPDRLQEDAGQVLQAVSGFVPNGLLKFAALPVPKDGPGAGRPLPTAACAGGFIFGSARILQDVPSDPVIFFNGEEPNLAVRLWTHGFDLFSPDVPLLYHYYARYDGARPWFDADMWQPRHAETLRRLRALCEPAGSTPEEVAALGPYGLGTRRSLQAYERFAGVNFAGRTVAAFARRFPYVRPEATDWPEEELLPEVGTTLFVLGEEGVLFAEATSDFYRLSPLGAFVWCAREAGSSWDEIAAARAREVPLADARAEIADLAAHWRGQGVLRALDTPAPKREIAAGGPRIDPGHFDFRTRHYTVLGITVALRYGDREIEHWVHPVLAHLRTDGPGPARRTLTLLRIGAYVYILSERASLHCGALHESLAPRVKYHLSRIVIGEHPHMLHLHSGAVALAGKLVLLPGQRGSGKTLLTARLLAAGAQYFSDEVVLIERGTAAVQPFPLSLCVKREGVDALLPFHPGLAELPEHEREDALWVRYLTPPLGSVAAAALAPSAVVFPRYEAGAPVRLQRLPAAETFARLMGECVAIPDRLAAADAAALVRAAEAWPGYELVSGNLDGSAEAVLSLLRE